MLRSTGRLNFLLGSEKRTNLSDKFYSLLDLLKLRYMCSFWLRSTGIIHFLPKSGQYIGGCLLKLAGKLHFFPRSGPRTELFKKGLFLVGFTCNFLNLNSWRLFWILATACGNHAYSAWNHQSRRLHRRQLERQSKYFKWCQSIIATYTVRLLIRFFLDKFCKLDLYAKS